MSWIGEVGRRVRRLVRGGQFDRELAEEMRHHLELKARAEGDPGAARRQFGNVTALQERSREAWGWSFLDTTAQDLRYALRNLKSSPGFAATAVLSLVLGIGANTAIFSIINAVMLRSLPVEDPQSLVELRMGDSGDDELNTPLWEQIRDHQQSFSATLAYAPARFDLAEGGESRFAEGLFVSGGYFDALGVRMMMGRPFSAADDQWGGGRDGNVAVISYKFWQRNFGGDPAVLGKTVTLDRHKFAVAGVTPPWFTGLDVERSFDVALPIGSLPVVSDSTRQHDESHHWWLRVMGRIPHNQTLQQAGDRLRAITPQIIRASLPAGEDPAEAAKTHFGLAPAGLGFSETRAQYRTALLVLMVTVGLVLLVACANIANLQMGRAAARQRELSVRMAIGASRARVVRQLMTESLLLALLGAGGGVLFAMWGSRVLMKLLSTTTNALEIGAGLDLRLLAFAMGVAVLTAVLFGLAPAIRATRSGLNHALKESERGTLRGATRFRFGKMLVSGQVALSFVLLLGAALFLGTLRNFLAIDPGFSRHNVLLVSATLPRATAVPDRTRMYREILAQLQSTPGVTSAASSVLTPIGRGGWAFPVQAEGFVPKTRGDNILFLNRVSEDYFRVLETPLLMGRTFNARDDLQAPLSILLNEWAARHFFGAANPIGKTVGMKERHGTDLYQVVGVVKDTKYNRLNEAQRPIGYLAAAQESQPGASLQFELRTAGRVDDVIPPARAAIGGVSRDIALEFRNLETQVNDSLLRPRVVALLSSVFGGLALVLAMVGLYGITSYAVAQRRGEIGIRMALGAQARSVIWLMLRDVAILAAVGLAAGLVASLQAGHLVVSLLFGVQFNDPVQMALAGLLLALAIAIAAYLPARRAARSDPMTALRQD